MSRSLYVRLSLLMFMQYFVPGAYLVTLGTYLLQNLHFSGTQTGIVYATFAVGGLVSPFVSGVLADKYFRLERLLACCFLGSGLLLLLCAQMHTFYGLLAVMLLHQCFLAPTFGLSSAYLLHQVKHANSDYPKVRVWGTVGWIVAGIIVGIAGWEATVWPMYVASFSALLTALYVWYMPSVAPQQQRTRINWRMVLGLDALRLLRQPVLFILAISLLLLSIATAFYDSFANPFFNEVGITQAAAKMTIGQIVEIVVILSMPYFFRIFPIRYMLLIGMAAWAIRYWLLSIGYQTDSVWMLYIGMGLHGVAYAYTFLTAQIFVDRYTPVGLRSSMQGLLALITMGIGRLSGSLISGKLVSNYQITDQLHNWGLIWQWPGWLSAVVCIGFFVSLKVLSLNKKT